MYEITAKTLAGLEETLAGELREIGAQEIKVGHRAVFFQGDNAILYKANLLCRTALKILKPIKTFSVRDQDDLYDKVKKINWLQYLTLNDTFRVDATVSSETFTHSQFVALKVKDAVADFFREKTQKRPSVDTFRPNLSIDVHILNDKCTISINSSGDALFKRGYKTKANVAPMSEVLAAGLIMLTGWRGETDFYDPMCGSGTLLIEAAMIAKNIPAGYFRKEFGFELWRDFDRELWAEIFTEAERKITKPKIKIQGSDIDWEAVKISKSNIANAHLTDFIDVKKFAFEISKPDENKAIVVMNPPYGERMQKEDIFNFYKTIGDKLKTDYLNKDIWILTCNLEALKALGLKTSRRIEMKNGNLDCKFVKYEIYEGSKKGKYLNNIDPKID